MIIEKISKILFEMNFRSFELRLRVQISDCVRTEFFASSFGLSLVPVLIDQNTED